MELQRCIWRCLANSAGADDPAYHACVEAQCSPTQQSTPAPQQQSEGGWRFGALDPGDWPYLEGGFATLGRPSEPLTIAFWCGVDGSSTLSLSGPSVNAVFGPETMDAQYAVLLAVGGARTLQLQMTWYEGALQAEVPRSDAPLYDLSIGSAVSVYSADRRLVHTLSLDGAATAIGTALAHCEG